MALCIAEEFKQRLSCSLHKGNPRKSAVVVLTEHPVVSKDLKDQLLGRRGAVMVLLDYQQPTSHIPQYTLHQ